MGITLGQRRTIRPGIRVSGLICILLAPLSLLAASHNDVEVKPFGHLGTDASFSVRYLLDENDRFTDSTVTSFEHRTTWEQEFFLMSRHYVYHPGFLNMELGGGPLLVQQSFDSLPGSQSSNETLFNVLTRFNFLDLKTYPFSLYYRRTYPSIVTSLSGRFLTRNEEYGFSGRKIFPDSATGITLDLSHRDLSGSGYGTVVDDVEDRGNIKISKGYRGDDSISFEHDRVTRDSSSGSVGLPIQESTIRQETSSVIARNTFGGDDQFVLNQSLISLNQENESTVFSKQDDLNYSASGRWQNTETVRSTFNYRYNDSEREGADVESHNSAAGFIHSPTEEIWYDVRADHETSKQTGFERKRTGISSTANFAKQTGFGSLGLAGTVRQERTDQESTSDTIRVFDEPVTLSGTTPVDLRNEFVVTSSVVVTNVAGTQVFVEDLDYRLIVIGSVTSIQRLIDGNIFDGQVVLVDYQYLTSGTAEFDTFSTNLVATLGFLEYASAQLRYGLKDSRLISGELTTPINDGDLVEFVIGADFPIGYSWRLGGEYRHTDQNEDIAPFVRDSISLNASTRINGSLRMYVSAGLVQVDQEESTEDVDQVNFRFGITGRVFGRFQLRYETAYLEDTGGSLARELLQHRFNLQGRYRKVRFGLRVVVSEDTLGTTKRDYTQVTADVTRDF